MEAKTNDLATDYEFLLMDRVQKIKSINELHDLEHNAYVSFSGGKDSTVLSRLIDEALPGNNIPRVFINTGIEYKQLVAFVERERERRTCNDYQATEECPDYTGRIRLSF